MLEQLPRLPDVQHRESLEFLDESYVAAYSSRNVSHVVNQVRAVVRLQFRCTAPKHQAAVE